eukprot:gene9970-20731_t
MSTGDWSPREQSRDVGYSKFSGKLQSVVEFFTSRLSNVDVSKVKVEIDVDEGQETDGGILARMAAREAIYGGKYWDNPEFSKHYFGQVETKMQSVVVGQSWTSLGPTYTPYPDLDSGRVRCMLIDPTDHNIVYVLTSGGLWKTTNFFANTNPTWLPLTDQLVTISGGYAALGSDPKTIYLGLGDPFNIGGIGGYFVKSTDGGSTWNTQVDLNTFRSTNNAAVFQVYNLVVDTSTDSDIIMVSTNLGIFRSTDGGEVFTHVYFATSEMGYLPQVFSIVKTGNDQSSWWWIGYDWTNGLLLVSNDAGLTWGSLEGTNWNDVVVYQDAAGAAVRGARATFAVAVQGESTIYAQVAKWDGTQLNIFRSGDGGVTWTPLNCNSNYAPTTAIDYLLDNLDIMGGQGWYDQMLLVDPTDSTRNTVYAGGSLTSIKTTDGGNSWSVISTWYDPAWLYEYYKLTYVHADFHAAVYTTSPGGVGTVIFGNDGGLFTSQNGGANWTSTVNKGLVTQQPNFICGSPISGKLMIGLQDLGTRERRDSSTTWYSVFGGDGDGCGYSQAKNKVNILSYYNNNMMCRYYVSGAFTPVMNCSSGIEDERTPFYTNLYTPTAAADPTGTIFFTLTYLNIYRSSMPRDTIQWNIIGTVGSNGISDGDIRQSFQSIGVGPTSINQVAVAKDTEICITIDGGTSWTTVTITNSISGWYKGTSPVWASSTVLYLASEDPTIGATRFIESTDTGSSWSSINTGSKLPDLPISKLFLSNTDTTKKTLFAATWIGVYVSKDGGVNWNVLGSGLPNVVVSDIYQMSTDLYIATYGRGVWKQSLLTSKPTKSPSLAPTNKPSAEPSTRPTKKPTLIPSSKPSKEPSNSPSTKPSAEPSLKPTRPTGIPTTVPTRNPSSEPSSKPTNSPTLVPTLKPSKEPSSIPTRNPTFTPSSKPSKQPSNSPSTKPSKEPSSNPTKPTGTPTNIPTKRPSSEPSNKPTKKPSFTPSSKPSKEPSNSPSKPTGIPKNIPSKKPSIEPSSKPTKKPSFTPSSKPSKEPSLKPNHL